MDNQTKVSIDPEKWLEEHGDYLTGYAVFRVRDQIAAEDLVQETFLAAFRGKERFQGKSSERTWLTAILKNKIYDYYKKRKREIPVSSLLPEDSGDFFDDKTGWVFSENRIPEWDAPEAAMDREAFYNILHQCLSKLPDSAAQIFISREMEEKSTEEVCEEMDITPNNLWVILHRTRRKLRSCLEKHWFHSSK